MKILGPNLFSTAGQVRQLDELNLKSGQRVVGKIISINQDDAFFELAGHTIQAKIEGESPAIGANQTFLVSSDAEGRTILKMINNSPAGAADNPIDSHNADSLKTTGNSADTSLQKAIVSALMKENLPVSPENVTKIARYMLEFQSRFQQPVQPEVFSFIIAQKWPMTPGTILAAWINQQPEIRDLLRKTLQEKTPKENFLLLESLLKLPADTLEITKKLQSASKLQSIAAKNIKEFDTGEQMLPASGSSPEVSKKLEYLLEQNIGVRKILLNDTNSSGSTSIIPLLVSDSNSNIHECFIEWKKEKGSSSQNNNTNIDQSIHVAIPTENLGTIHLRLKISSGGVQINLGVAHEEICQYLTSHAEEIKSAIAKENVMIAVRVSDEEKTYQKAYGVDLWM